MLSAPPFCFPLPISCKRMAPSKKTKKACGLAKKTPSRPQPPSSSSDEEAEAPLFREIFTRVEALEKSRAEKRSNRGGEQAGPSRACKEARKITRHALLSDLASRLASLESEGSGEVSAVSAPALRDQVEGALEGASGECAGNVPQFMGVQPGQEQGSGLASFGIGSEGFWAPHGWSPGQPSGLWQGSSQSLGGGPSPVGQVWRGPSHSMGFPASYGQSWQAPGGNGTFTPSDIPPFAYMERSLALGDHLLPSTKVKIWRGEYIDLFTLLFRDVEVKPGAKDDPRELEKIKRQQVDKNFDNWLTAYTIYMGVVLQVQPARGPVLVKYLDLIHRAYKEYAGAAWLRYDEMFRSRAAMDPSLPWDREHQQLWSQCMGPAVAFSGRYTDSGHLVARSPGEYGQGMAAGRGVATKQWVQPPHLVCWEFNSKGKCTRKGCRFKHTCSICMGPHAAVSCWKGSANRAGGSESGGAKKQQPPSAGKGSQSSQS